GHNHVPFVDQRLVSHPGIGWKIEIYLHTGQGWFFQHFHGEWRGRKSIGSKKEIGVIRYIIYRVSKRTILVLFHFILKIVHRDKGYNREHVALSNHTNLKNRKL